MAKSKKIETPENPTKEQLIEEAKATLTQYDEKRTQHIEEVLFPRVIERIETIVEKFYGVAGMLAVSDAIKTFYEDGTPIEVEFCQQVAKSIADSVRGILNDYNDMKHKYEQYDHFLDKYVVKFDAVPSKKEVITAICMMSVCQEIWAAIREVPEFYNQVQGKMQEMIEYIEREEAEQ